MTNDLLTIVSVLVTAVITNDLSAIVFVFYCSVRMINDLPTRVSDDSSTACWSNVLPTIINDE